MLTTGTYLKRKIFDQSDAANIVLDSLHWLEKKERIDLEAAVVMPDHLHFIARLHSDSLSGLMHSLKSFTAKRINALFRRGGKVWQSQYHDHAIRKDEVLRDTVIYCLNNPVREGLVRDFHEYPHWYCRYKV